MKDLRLIKLRFSLIAREPLSLPAYQGSTLRGGFGHALKRVSCTIKHKQCAECLLRDKCVYSYVFETPLPEGAERLKGSSYLPHPFVIEPSLEGKREYEPGERLNFNLVLVGKTIDYLPYFIYAFDEMGRTGLGKGKGQCEVDLAEDAVVEKVIYRGSDKTISSAPHILTLEQIAAGREPTSSITLSFLTPTRIKYESKFVLELEFHVLIRNLLRRISSLCYFHTESSLDVDFTGLIKAAREIKTTRSNLRWSDWIRYSRRQDTSMQLGGFKGEITFQGELTPFWPFILLGEYLHVGKGAGFGLGKYRLE